MHFNILSILTLAAIVSCQYEDIFTTEPFVIYSDTSSDAPNTDTDTVQRQNATKGCGFRNEGGISIRVTENKSRDVIFGEFPWVVAVYAYNRSSYVYHCVGSLIHPKIVMSTAHSFVNVSNIRIVAGEHELYGSKEVYKTQSVDVDRIVNHPQFVWGGSQKHTVSIENDVALLFLKSEVTMAPNVGLVCLPPAHTPTPPGTKCIVAGWGQNSVSSAPSSIMKMVEVPIIALEDCKSRIARFSRGWFRIHSSHLCAGGEAGVDACTKDGGGPLVCEYTSTDGRFYQAGIVSWGISCGQAEVPGGYTNVVAVRSWIDETVVTNGFSITYDP